MVPRQSGKRTADEMESTASNKIEGGNITKTTGVVNANGQTAYPFGVSGSIAQHLAESGLEVHNLFNSDQALKMGYARQKTHKWCKENIHRSIDPFQTQALVNAAVISQTLADPSWLDSQWQVVRLPPLSRCKSPNTPGIWDEYSLWNIKPNESLVRVSTDSAEKHGLFIGDAGKHIDASPSQGNPRAHVFTEKMLQEWKIYQITGNLMPACNSALDNIGRLMEASARSRAADLMQSAAYGKTLVWVNEKDGGVENIIDRRAKHVAKDLGLDLDEYERKRNANIGTDEV